MLSFTCLQVDQADLESARPDRLIRGLLNIYGRVFRLFWVASNLQLLFTSIAFFLPMVISEVIKRMILTEDSDRRFHIYLVF